MHEQWNEWTSCEMCGHDFDDNGTCRDCPARSTD